MKKETKYSIIGICLLVFTAFIWGFAFVEQKKAMDFIGPLMMNGLRSLLAAVFLLPTALIVDKIKGKKITLLGTTDKESKKTVLIGGVLCGILLTLASTLQQYGIDLSTVGESGFLTTLYIIIVPVIGLILGKKVNWNGWVAVLLGLVGMGLICIKGDKIGIDIGNVIVIISAVFFAIHIMVVDKYTKVTDGIRLSFMQFLICGIVCTITGIIVERPEMSAILKAWFPIFFVGVLSAGVGYTLQIIAQKWVKPHIASLVMSLESVFSLLAGAIFLQEQLSLRQYIGCFVMFVAIIIAQLNLKMFSKKKEVFGIKNSEENKEVKSGETSEGNSENS